MTIRKGEQWGSSIKMPTHIRQAHSDADIAQCSSGEFISITGGDILFQGQSILELSPEERAHRGIFLGFQRYRIGGSEKAFCLRDYEYR